MIHSLRNEPILSLSLTLSLLMLILKLVFISSTMLIDDESFYWVWSQHPAMGYMHAPGLAFIIRFFSEILGDNAFAVRFSGVFLYFVLAYWAYRMGREWKDERTGLIFATLICLIPFYLILSIIITCDMPMVFFLFLSTWYYHKAYLVDKKYFYPAGVLLGLAAICKSPSILVAFSLFLYAFVHPDRKKHLKTKEMWFSFVIAAFIYSPFIIWNVQNDFIFFTYLQGIFTSRPGSLAKFGELWAAQVGLYLPITFILMLFIYIKTFIDYRRRQISEVNFFFAFSSLAPIIYLLYKSWVNRLEANWPVFGFVGLVFLLVHFYSKHWEKRWVRYCYFGNNLFSFSLVTLLMLHVWFGIFPYSPGDITNRYYQFNAIRGEFKQYYQEKMDKDVRIMSRNYQTPSMINLYVRPKLEAAYFNLGNYHLSIYNTVYPDEVFRGQDFYYIYHGEDTWYPRLFDLFDEVKEVKRFSSYRGNKKVRTFTLYYCKNYRGNDIYFNLIPKKNNR